MDRKALGVAAALGSAAAWAAGALLFKRIGEIMSPFAMTLTKGTISIVLLAVALLAVEYRRGSKEKPFSRLRTIDRRSLLLLVISGFVGISVADTCFFAALSLLSPHTVVLLMMVGFILTPLLAMVFLREPSTLARWLGIALVLGGIMLVLTTGTAEEAADTRVRGIILGLLSVISMSVSFVIAKKALESMTALQGTFVRMLIGTLGMLVFGALTGRLRTWVLPLSDPGLVTYFVAAVAVITFGGFWLTHVAIKNVDLTIANTLMATEPVFVLIFGALFLGNRITLIACAGTVLALSGVTVLFRTAAAGGAPDTGTQEETQGM
jgi:drug/metabolite transporter (DMT)-like permease